MTASALRRVPADALRRIAVDAVESGRIPDAQRLLVLDAVPAFLVDPVAEALAWLAGPSAEAATLARHLVTLADDRDESLRAAPRVEVVWSGPEEEKPCHRTTLAVVQELFLTFNKSLLIASYSLDAEERLRAILISLAARMDADPELHVRLFLDLKATAGGHAQTADEAAAHLGRRFREHLWPGQRLPELWYDPRAFGPPGDRAVLHAKCVVADDHSAFVTSANLSEAAQGRNVELGVLVRDGATVRDIRAAFDALIATGSVVQVG